MSRVVGRIMLRNSPLYTGTDGGAGPFDYEVHTDQPDDLSEGSEKVKGKAET